MQFISIISDSTMTESLNSICHSFSGRAQVEIQLIWDHPEFGGNENERVESADGRGREGRGRWANELEKRRLRQITQLDIIYCNSYMTLVKILMSSLLSPSKICTA